MCAKCDTLEDDLTVEVLLAEAEHALILAQTDAGESVPGAIRPLSAAERKAKMRFSEIEALEQSAADQAAKLLASNAQLYVIAVIGAIFGDRDSADAAQIIAAFEHLNRAQPKVVITETARATEAIASILEQVYAGASLIALGEASRQGVPDLPDPLTADAGRFDHLARMVALHPWTRLTSKLQTDMLTPKNLATPFAKADVETALKAIPLDGAEDLARQSIYSAHGQGRLETIAPMNPVEVIASELLDGETCPKCFEVDGKEYESFEAGKVEYEAGFYGACLGGGRCRGTLVVIY